jgi:hypothetical protein
LEDGRHNPFVDVIRDTTTSYASDRDVFLFLVDDTHPIEAGRQPARPTSISGGSIAGTRKWAVCQNRNLWGVKTFEEITIRHNKYAASRFAHEGAPRAGELRQSPASFVAGIRAARERIVARTDEDRSEFLRKRGFSKHETAHIIETVLHEEGRPPESVFDFVQGITAVARDKEHRDARLELKRLLDRIP